MPEREPICFSNSSEYPATTIKSYSFDPQIQTGVVNDADLEPILAAIKPVYFAFKNSFLETPDSRRIADSVPLGKSFK